MQKKGFTLVELLAVIVILALLATVAVPNVVSILKKEKQNTDEIAVTNLNDAAISYAKEQISLQKLHLNSCNFTIGDVNTAALNASGNNKCVVVYQVSFLQQNGAFDDKRKSCDSNANIYVYKYNNGKYDELRTFIPANTCGSNKSNDKTSGGCGNNGVQ